jgi:hypothetical protein
MKIFAEQDLYAVLEGRLQQVKQEIFSAGSDYLLNTNETQYVEYLASRYRIEPVTIDFEGVSASTREEMIAAERFPNAFEFNIERGRRYPKQVITYHLPFSGNAELLRCKPSSRILWTTEVRLEQGAVCFDVVNWRGEADSIKREADQIIGNIRQQAGNVTSEVAGFNNRLAGEAPRIVQARKAELLKQANLLGALGVPIKKADQVPSTFAVPVAKKSLVITKPAASVGPFKPEPTLNPELYRPGHSGHHVGCRGGDGASPQHLQRQGRGDAAGPLPHGPVAPLSECDRRDVQQEGEDGHSHPPREGERVRRRVQVLERDQGVPQDD